MQIAYCGNNPTIRSDDSGNSWFSTALNWLTDTAAKVGGWIGSLFGAESIVVHQSSVETAQIPDPYPITLTTGTEVSTTIWKCGDSTKPISVYAKGRADDYLKSSVGININAGIFRLNISLGLDDIGVSVGAELEGKMSSFGIKADVTRLKVGFELASTYTDNDSTSTVYGNASVSAWAIVALYAFLVAGQPVLQPA